MPRSGSPPSKWLNRFAWFTAVATLFSFAAAEWSRAKTSDSPSRIGRRLSATTCFFSRSQMDRRNFFRAHPSSDRFHRRISHHHSRRLALAIRSSSLGTQPGLRRSCRSYYPGCNRRSARHFVKGRNRNFPRVSRPGVFRDADCHRACDHKFLGPTLFESASIG